MGYLHLVHAAIALLSLLAADLAEPELRLGLGWLVPCVALPHVCALLARREFLRGRHRRGVFAYEVLRHVAVALHVFAVLGCAWGEHAKAWTGGELLADGLWPRAGLLIGLAPWLVFELLAVDAQARLRAATREQIGAARTFELRMRAAALAPLAFLFVLSVAIGWNDAWRVRVTHVGVLGASFAAFLLVAMVLCAPLLLRAVWDTRELARGDLRAELDDVARRASFHCAALLEWRTGGRIANAAILGVHARTRVVVLTDALIEQLGTRELRAVYAHEIGHAKAHHVLSFAAWTIAILVGGGWALERVLPADDWIALLALLPLLGAWFVALGWLSRRFELEADLHALHVLDDPLALIHALAQVTGVHAHDKDSWRHFSSKRRIAFLVDASRDPRVGATLQRRLRALRAIGVVVAIGVVLARGAALTRAWNDDMAWADLRLGRYASAVARAASSDDAQLQRLAAQTTQLAREQAPSRGPAELLARAETSYDALDFQSGRNWLELAALRGDDEATKLMEAVEWLESCETVEQRFDWQLLALGTSTPTPWKRRLWNADGAARESAERARTTQSPARR